MSEKGKEAGIAVTAEELARINRFAKKELRAEEVYTFAVKLCDNEVDRDFERFDRAALEKLSELFVGRTGIFDHSWSAGGQTARIYRAEVIEEETRTTAGDKYCWCKGWAYMLRTEKNAELIAEIEGGIKKEVSVGCSAAKRSCSICGKDAGLCEHERGKYYGGKLCYAVLSDITDAYDKYAGGVDSGLDDIKEQYDGVVNDSVLRFVGAGTAWIPADVWVVVGLSVGSLVVLGIVSWLKE